MATPRRQLVAPDRPMFYHLVSRCVRRAWLCGVDPRTKKDYTHRKQWLLSRLEHLGSAFAVEICAYAIMSNHFHLVVYYDPTASESWTDFEVASRWLAVCPPKLRDGTIDEGMLEFKRESLLENAEQLKKIRAALSSLSVFMKLLKQPIARKANQEDECSGHFFEQRFYSAALLTEEAVVAAMAYVDLNPIRAKIAHSLEESEHTSIKTRLEDSGHAENLEEYLAPLISGIDRTSTLKMSLKTYISRLKTLILPSTDQPTQEKLQRWRDQVSALKRPQRAFGSAESLETWIEGRGWQMREIPLPV